MMARSNGIYTIPNGISLLRALLGPFIAMLLLIGTRDMLLAALALMLLAEASDFADGYVARKYGQSSDLGEFIDPVSDSIYRLSIFFAFFYNDWMPVWMFILIYARDLVVPYLRTFTIQAGADLPVRLSGKIKAVAQGVAQVCVVAILADPFRLGEMFSGVTIYLLLATATLISTLSLIDYFAAAMRQVRASSGS